MKASIAVSIGLLSLWISGGIFKGNESGTSQKAFLRRRYVMLEGDRWHKCSAVAFYLWESGF